MYRTQEELAAQLGITADELARHLPCHTPRCAGHFVVRVNRLTGDVFFGCSRFPNCTTTRQTWDVNAELLCTVIGECEDDGSNFSKW